MKTLTVTEMNRNPSAPLREVQAGNTVIITSHGKPIARIVGITEAEWEQTLKMLALAPVHPSAKSHFIVPPFLDIKSRPAYKKEKLTLPHHLNWSHIGLVFDMSRPSSRAQLYEIVLEEGSIKDIQEYISFPDLKELWPTLYLPTELRKAWETMYTSLKE